MNAQLQSFNFLDQIKHGELDLYEVYRIKNQPYGVIIFTRNSNICAWISIKEIPGTKASYINLQQPMISWEKLNIDEFYQMLKNLPEEYVNQIIFQLDQARTWVRG